MPVTAKMDEPESLGLKTPGDGSWRVFTGLTLLVLLAHVLLIAQSVGMVEWAPPQAAAILRFTLVAAGPEPKPQVQPRPVVRPKAVPAKTATPRPQAAASRPEPTPDLADNSAGNSAELTAAPANTEFTAAPANAEAPPLDAVASHTDGAVAHSAPTAALPDAPELPVFDAAGKIEPPPGWHLQYRAGGKYRFFPIAGGEAVLDWSPSADGRYQLEYSLAVKGIGTMGMYSRGQWDDSQGLLPERFAIVSKNERAAHFQRDKGVISFSNNKPDQPLLPGAQDMASLFVTLGALLQADPQRFPTGTVIGIQTASVNSADVWSVHFIGEETIHPPYGPLKTLHLQARSSDKYEYVLDWWLAPDLRYLPAQVRVTAQAWHAQTDLLTVAWKNAASE